jgi:hypothetical protein
VIAVLAGGDEALAIAAMVAPVWFWSHRYGGL